MIQSEQFRVVWECCRHFALQCLPYSCQHQALHTAVTTIALLSIHFHNFSHYFLMRLKCMGARRHGQEGALRHLLRSGNVVKCFCPLVVTAKCSTDELFMHYFTQTVVGFWGLHPKTPCTRALSLDSAGDFCPQTPNLPTPGKNPAGAYAKCNISTDPRIHKFNATCTVLLIYSEYRYLTSEIISNSNPILVLQCMF